MHNIKRYLFVLSFLFSLTGYCQEQSYERVPVVLKGGRALSVEMNLITSEGMLYLPLKETFENLGIKADVDQDKMYISGFFENRDSAYFIDILNRTAKFNKRSLVLAQEDVITSGDVIYLRDQFINDFFNLGLKYNPRLLTVTADSTRRIPILKYYQLRRNFLARQKKEDFRIPPEDIYFEPEGMKTGAGRINWSHSFRYNEIGLYSNYYSELQSKIAGGDLDIVVRGNTRPRKFIAPNLRAQYRYPIPNNKAISQIIFGQGLRNGLFSYDILGVEITNRPLSGRIIHSVETFESVAAPNSSIEVSGGLRSGGLIDMQGGGPYSFNIPMKYGPTQFRVKAFDRYGWLGTRTYLNNIPQEMVPPGEVEYSSSFGKLTHTSGQYVSSNSVKVGVSSLFTIGGMIDYYDVAQLSNKWHGALSSTAHLFSSLNFNAIVSPNAYSKYNLHFMPSSISEFYVTRTYFVQNTPRNFGNAVNQWNLFASQPLLASNKLRLSFEGSNTKFSNYQDYTLSGTLMGIVGNLIPSVTSRIIRSDVTRSMETRSHYTELNLSATLPLNLLVHGSLAYDHLDHEVRSLRFSAERRFFGNLHARFSVQRFPTIPSGIIFFELRYLFPFLDVRASVSRTDDSDPIYGMNFTGSMGFDLPRGSFNWSHSRLQRTNSGFTFHPFVDENNNDIRDDGEQAIEIGKILVQDNTYASSPFSMGKNRFTLERLLPYKSYTFYFDPTSLDDPRLVSKYSSIRINSDAYYTRDVDIPLVYGGTVRGIVLDESSKPMEGVPVTITSLRRDPAGEDKIVKKTATFSTGEYEFTLLSPGRYKIEIDAPMLRENNFSAKPARREITLVSKAEGDAFEKQDFQLIKKR